MLQSICIKCFKEYTDVYGRWCEPCQINDLKKNFTNWTSGNKQIDDFIQKQQLEISYNDLLLEWISYDQLNDAKEIGKSDFIIVYSAVWKNGPLYYDYKDKKEWMRKSNERVALKCFQSIDELLNEV